MKTPQQFAEHYLTFKLGSRKGLDYKEIVQDEKIQKEIVDQLAKLIEERDIEILLQYGIKI